MRDTATLIWLIGWALAGLLLTILSKLCAPIDPLIPALCLGVLVGWICYAYLGQGQKDSTATGNLFGWKVSVNGAIVIIGVSTALIWSVLRTGRECIGALTFTISGMAHESRLQAETLSPPKRLVGYVEGSSLKKAIGKLIAEDYFHPVLQELRQTVDCYLSAKCAENAGFYVGVAEADHVKQGVVEICDDTNLGAESQELQEMIRGLNVSSVTLTTTAQNQRHKTKVFRLMTGDQTGHAGACHSDAEDLTAVTAANKAIRVYGLLNPEDFRAFRQQSGADARVHGLQPRQVGPQDLGKALILRGSNLRGPE